MKTRTKVLLLAATLGWPGWGMPLTAEDLPGAASPQEVMKRSWEAAETGEQALNNNLIEPVFRRQWAISKLKGADSLLGYWERDLAPAEEKAEAAEARKRFHDLLTAHGLASALASGTAISELPDEALAALVERVDQGALIDELDDFTLTIHPVKGLSQPPLVRVEATDYRITGDRATARVGDGVIEFVRVDGRWYFAPPPIPKVVEPKCGVPPRPTERHHAGSARGCG